MTGLPPDLTPDEVAARLRRLPPPDPARARAVLPAVARRWLEPQNPYRVRTVQAVAARTGYAPGWIEAGLDHLMGELSRGLGAWVDAELPAGWVRRPGLRSRWVAPERAVILLAGNVPGAGLADIAGLLAIGSAVLCKVAAGEPYLATAFAESVREADPALGESLAAVYWPGTSAPHLEAALRGAEAAVAYGSDESVRQVAARVRPGTLLLTYGHRLSLAVVGEGAPPDAAARAALDVAFYDQQGCVSPHTLYVLGDAAAFAEAMGAALDRLEGLHPRGPLRPGEAAAIRQARDEAEWKPGARLVGGAGDDLRWTVILDEADRALRPSPLMRTVRVHPLHTVAELPALVQAVRPWLQTCGFAGRPADAERLALLLGVSRICPLGRAQFPRLQWHHDGQAVLSRLVRWVDIEEEGAG